MTYNPDQRWSEAQDEMLMVYYPTHGCNWQGWKEVLPERTRRAIEVRAHRLGITSRAKPIRTKPRKPPKRTMTGDGRHHISEVPLRPDPYEGRVMRMMGEGMTPPEIDKRLKFWPGTARMIISERWRRLKELGK